MSVAIRAITRVQDADDFGSTPGAGNDGYALTWDNGAGEFVLAAAGGGVTDHGALSGLSDNDHAQYILKAGDTTTGLLINAIEDAATNTVTNVATYRHTTTGTAAIGLGASMVFQLENSLGNVVDASKISAAFIGDAGALWASDLRFSTGYIGSLGERLIINSIGCVGIGKTPTVLLDVNGEISIPSASQIRLGPLSDGGFSGIYGPSKAFAGVTLGPALFGWDGGVLGVYPGAQAIVLRWAAAGVSIGKNTPSTRLDVLLTSAATNAVTNVLTIGHDTTGTAAAGFGAGQLFQLESSTTAAQNAGRIVFKWGDATHATRFSIGQATAYYTSTEHTPVTWGANSSGALLSFYDVTTPIAQQVLATGAGASVDNVISALQNLGLVKQS